MTLSSGTPVGKYVVRKKIAEGGMAEIYLCASTGPEGFEKEVVIKRIRAFLASDPSFIDMFIREAQLASRLNHPNIVQIFDFDKHEDTYYLAMEYVNGRSVWELRKKTKELLMGLPPVLVAHIGSEVARGLHYAHQLKQKGKLIGIVHRDVTPHNVLLSFDGAVKLTDFGIAKVDKTGTAPGMLKGKFAYMSPEQARGEAVDARTDVFALGIVLWEMLTGGRLFDSDSELGVLRAVQQSVIPPPARLNPDVPDALSQIVMKALERDLSQRYASAQDLERALKEFVLRHADSLDDTDVGGFLRKLFPEEATQIRGMSISLSAITPPPEQSPAQSSPIERTAVKGKPYTPPPRSPDESGPTSAPRASGSPPTAKLPSVSKKGSAPAEDELPEGAPDPTLIIRTEALPAMPDELSNVRARDGEARPTTPGRLRSIPVPGSSAAKAIPASEAGQPVPRSVSGTQQLAAASTGDAPSTSGTQPLVAPVQGEGQRTGTQSVVAPVVAEGRESAAPPLDAPAQAQGRAHAAQSSAPESKAEDANAPSGSRKRVSDVTGTDGSGVTAVLPGRDASLIAGGNNEAASSSANSAVHRDQASATSDRSPSAGPESAGQPLPENVAASSQAPVTVEPAPSRPRFADVQAELATKRPAPKSSRGLFVAGAVFLVGIGVAVAVGASSARKGRGGEGEGRDEQVLSAVTPASTGGLAVPEADAGAVLLAAVEAPVDAGQLAEDGAADAGAVAAVVVVPDAGTPPRVVTPVRKKGTLRLSVVPWAKVTIDGVNRGEVQTAKLFVLDVGEHRLRLEHTRGTREQKVTITAGQITPVTVNMLQPQ